MGKMKETIDEIPTCPMVVPTGPHPIASGTNALQPCTGPRAQPLISTYLLHDARGRSNPDRTRMRAHARIPSIPATHALLRC